MDIEALLDDAAVLLDLTETSLERIIHTVLTKTLDILDAPLAYEEAMTTLFLPESGNILAKTIQVFFSSIFQLQNVFYEVTVYRGRSVLMGQYWKMISPGS